MNDDIDERYRQAAAREAGAPAESTRRAILAHAAALAAQRSAGVSVGVGATPASTPARTGRTRWRRPALFGTLAAAALAGLMVVPQFLRPAMPPPAAPMPYTVSRDSATPSPVAAEPAAPVAPAAPSGRLQQTAPAMAELAARRSADTATAELAAAAPRALVQALPPTAAAGAARVAAPADIDARDAEGRTALINAVLRSDAAAVRSLLAHGADPTIAAPDGRTPLQIAADGKDPGIVALLQEATAR